MHAAFEVHILNPAGIEKAKKIAEAFDRFLAYLDKNFYTDDNLTPTVAQSRERSILVTKLEEAAFYAKKALASRKENQAI